MSTSEIESLHREIDELRAKVSALIEAHNTDTVYHENLHIMLSKMVREYPWRYVMWLLPIPIPWYRKNVIPHFPPRRDSVPILRGKAEDDPPIIRGRRRGA